MSVSLFGAFRQIGVLTAISRGLGFVRDVLLAAVIGAGPLADAFFVALKLPNLFRRLTAEGAMTNAFLPAYVRTKGRSCKKASGLAAEIQGCLLWGLVVVVVVMEVFMPVVIAFMAPGFLAQGFDESDGRFGDAVLLARITLPYMPMISLVAFWAAVGNANGHFWGGASMPIVFNLSLMTGAVLSSASVALGVMPVAVAVPIAGVLQMVLMQSILARLNKRPLWRFWPKISIRGKAVWSKFFTAALGASSTQLNLLVDTILASLLPVGAISALYYADRIAQLPLGVIGTALGVALLPRLSQLQAAGASGRSAAAGAAAGAVRSAAGEGVSDASGDASDASEALAEIRKTTASGLRLGLMFGLPSMVGVLILAELIISGLFGYGAFSDAMIAPTARVLMAYALGIPAFVMVKVLQPSFYAAGDANTPLKISLFSVAVNIAASLTLMQIYGVVGLALATSMASWVSVVVLVGVLWRGRRIDGAIFAGLAPLLASVLVMGGGLLAGLYVYRLGGVAMAGAIESALSGFWGDFGDVFALIFLVLLGLGVYFGMLLLTGGMPKGWRSRKG